MFGSKIRTWMENHLRSKRKANKKNANSSSNQSEKLSQNGTKGHFLSPNNDSNVGSPRRCEVSPVSHKTSRKGWQTPDTAPNDFGYSTTIRKNDCSPVIRVTTPEASSKYSSNTMKSSSYFSPSPHKNRSSFSSNTVSSMNSLQPYDRNRSSDSLTSREEKRFSTSSTLSSISMKTTPRNPTYILDNSHFQKKPPVTYNNNNNTNTNTNNNNNINNNNNHNNSNNHSTTTQLAGETILNNNQLPATRGRYNNHLLPQHPNTLSSPESAYSTGYSTDGTSPNGCTNVSSSGNNSECYYVNIRTGTHYFPKNTTNQHETNRFKCGLNRIDEKESEHANYGHRRIESYDASYNSKNERSLTPNRAEPYLSPLMKNRNYYRSIESPSPRQRCRIRTNPWLSETVQAPPIPPKPEPTIYNSDKHLSKSEHFSESTDTSSTEKQMTRKIPAVAKDSSISEAKSRSRTITGGQESDEDATLNEVLGKFDESYIYEKETDILSDSDQTDCMSDFDTGQDAGDEFDTDDLLDFDFIDTGSAQEILPEKYSNTGSCSYHAVKPKPRKGCRSDECSKRKKRRTRKKHAKVSTPSSNNSCQPQPKCQSAGNTPVCLRRSAASSHLSNRSNSLTFTEIHTVHSRMVGLSTSEKALLKADLEADFKYKQLIHEAEKILVNMKSTVSVMSPRRICNLPTNKRVEMLRNDEVELKREMSKTQNKDGIVMNKRLEILKHDNNSSVPSSPRSGRASPLKTHVTNFINQNTDELMKVKVPPDLSSSKNSLLPSSKSPSSFCSRFESDSESDASRRPRPPPPRKPPIQTFRSVDMGYTIPDIFYCPQSEPLKRKVYTCSGSNPVHESTAGSSITPYNKMSRAKREQQQQQKNYVHTTDTGSSYDRLTNSSELDTLNYDSRRQQLIMNTIADIKRSLLDQSIELNGLHDSDT